MKSFRFALLFVFGSVLGAFTPQPSHALDCLTNTWAAPYEGGTSTDPAYAWPGAGYDLIAGTMYVSSAGGTEVGSSAGLLIRDLYWIVGPASAEPISFRVKLHTTGLARGGIVDLPNVGEFCSTSAATIRLSSGPAYEESFVSSQSKPTCTGDVPIDITQELPLLHAPNAVFEVAYNYSLRNYYRMSVTTQGQIMFEGLPPGYTIQSCQGYAGPVVPVAPRSWGMLKHAYR